MSSTTTPSRPFRRLLAALLAMALAIGAGATAVTASPAAGRPNTGPKPTVVLVHGGWDNSTGWNAVVERLVRSGYPVIAPANPLRSLASDAEYVSSILDTIEGPIVLVGHSYGGAVITNAAVGHDNVEALVYIAGFAPDTGESLFQLVTMNPGSEIGPGTLITRPYPLPDGTQGIDLYLTREGLGPRSPPTSPARSPTRCTPPSGPSPRRPSGAPRVRPPGRRSRRGTSWRPRTGRSRRPLSGSWPSGPVRTPAKSKLRTCRRSPSQTPPCRSSRQPLTPSADQHHPTPSHPRA